MRKWISVIVLLTLLLPVLSSFAYAGQVLSADAGVSASADASGNADVASADAIEAEEDRIRTDEPEDAGDNGPKEEEPKAEPEEVQQDDVKETPVEYQVPVVRVSQTGEMLSIHVDDEDFHADGLQVDVEALDVDGRALSAAYHQSDWMSYGQMHDLTLTFQDEANYRVDITYVSRNGLHAPHTQMIFTLDQSGPQIHASWKKTRTGALLEAISFGAIESSYRLELEAEDTISGISSIQVVHGGRTQNLTGERIVKGTGGTGTAAVDVNAGSTTVLATDKEGNVSQLDVVIEAEEKAVVSEEIAPGIFLEMREPDQITDGISYYRDAVEIKIMLTEGSSLKADEILVNGTAAPVEWSGSAGTWTISEDGTYQIRIMAEQISYTSDTFVIDRTDPELTLTLNNEEMQAAICSADASIAVSIEDEHPGAADLTLIRRGPDGSIEDIPWEYENPLRSAEKEILRQGRKEGIYRLLISAEDAAGNQIIQTAEFVLRGDVIFGWNDAVADLMVREIEEMPEEDLQVDLYYAAWPYGSLVVQRDGMLTDIMPKSQTQSLMQEDFSGTDATLSWTRVSACFDSADFTQGGRYEIGLEYNPQDSGIAFTVLKQTVDTIAASFDPLTPPESGKGKALRIGSGILLCLLAIGRKQLVMLIQRMMR